MVVIPLGTFRMGDISGGGKNTEKPVHKVRIGQSIAVGRFELTRGEFAIFVNETGYNEGDGCLTYESAKWEQRTDRSWQNPAFSQKERDPVVCVNWDEAKAYVSWLSERTGQAYRLLSESEWEYMARAGSTSKYYFGSSDSSLCDYGNAADQSTSLSWRNKSCNDGYGEKTAPAGTFKANGFGVHDTIGNVWEWVEDCWHDSYSGAPVNGRAWTTGGNCSYRVLRGASTFNSPKNLRSASRGRGVTTKRASSGGFRVARDLTPAERAEGRATKVR
jgi:formylglycine-generating enzyme required for sulfatase activity